MALLHRLRRFEDSAATMTTTMTTAATSAMSSAAAARPGPGPGRGPGPGPGSAHVRPVARANRRLDGSGADVSGALPTLASVPTARAAREVADGPRTAAASAPRRPADGPRQALPPSVARVAARTRLSGELLAAILEVDERQRATLDDIERADALAERLLARRRDRQRAADAPPSAVSMSA
jgi:hypothetical protein